MYSHIKILPDDKLKHFGLEDQEDHSCTVSFMMKSNVGILYSSGGPPNLS